MTALMVCIRFSAWSNTIECSDSKTSSVTSSSASPVLREQLLADRGLPVVEGGQAVHEPHVGVPGLGEQRAVDLVGQQLSIRLPHTDASGSPIETHTSV